MEQIRRAHEANFEVYSARKVWRQLGRDGIAVARCTVERPMRRMGLRDAVRGKETRTTIADKASLCPADKVNRHFQASRPNVLWVRTSPTGRPGRASCMWPSSSTSSPAASSAGGHRARPMLPLFSMPWSRRCMSAVR